MATLVQLSRNIRSRGSQIENNSARAVRRASRRALRSLVNSTPVDKGVARSNWRVSIGNPTRTTIAAYAPGRKLGISESANASAAIAAGLTTINRLRPGRGKRLTSALYITNNVSYIDRLNSGSSGQAPAGFIEEAVQSADRELQSVRLFSR